MKVLMIGWELPPFNSGGLGVACYFIAKELSKRIDLTFALPEKLPIENPPFKVIFATPENFEIRGYLEKYGLGINADLLSLVFNYAEMILKVYREKPDFVHGHDWFTSPATYFLSQYFKVPSLLHVHSTEFERSGGNPNPVIFQIEKEYFSKIDKLLPVGELTKDILIKVYGIAEDKIFVLPNGFDWSPKEILVPQYLQYLKDNNWKIVIFVGRLVLQKGPDYFLRTLPLVKKYFPKVKYVLVGSGDMFSDLVKITKELNIEENVLFTSFLREEKLWGVYSSADILVVPSLADPFGLVVLEGISFDLPVIASRQTGAAHYLSHMMKFEFWDVNEMANKIISLLKYDKMNKEYRKNIYSEARKKFDWQKTAEDLYNLYLNLK